MSHLSDTATFRRTATAAGLVVAAVASAASVVLQPPFPDGYAARLAAIHDAGASAAVSAALFTVAQLPMLAAVLGIAHLLRRGAPVASNLGGLLGVLGTFGHAVFGGVALVTVVMAADPAQRAVHAALLQDVESSPLMLFAATGLIGTVLGLLTLSIGLWRSRVVARWVPGTLWVFLVVEFVGTNLSHYATYVSGLCFLAAFGAIARQVWESPRSEWAEADVAVRPVAEARAVRL
jgi:hypothetical protein